MRSAQATTDAINQHPRPDEQNLSLIHFKKQTRLNIKVIVIIEGLTFDELNGKVLVVKLMHNLLPLKQVVDDQDLFHFYSKFDKKLS